MESDKDKGLRYNEGKLRWSLVPFSSLSSMVRVLMFGANKYADFNWQKGLPTREICESLLRHTYAFMEGEDNDPESGIEHYGHMMCNAMFLAWMMENKKEMDNRHEKTS